MKKHLLFALQDDENVAFLLMFMEDGLNCVFVILLDAISQATHC
jgi:hypothetical protein